MFIITLNIVMVSVVMLNVVTLSVVMLNVIMLSVVVPKDSFYLIIYHPIIWILVFGRLKLKIARLKKINGSEFVASHMFLSATA